MATNKPRPPVISLSYKCIRSGQEGLVSVLNENSYSMAEYNERTGRFVWMRVLPITQRESVEGWVRAQFAPQNQASASAKAAPPKGKASKAD